jgi:hypothetical protein
MKHNLRPKRFLNRPQLYFDEAEANVVLADVLVLAAEEGGRGDAEQVPLLRQPLQSFKNTCFNV